MRFFTTAAALLLAAVVACRGQEAVDAGSIFVSDSPPAAAQDEMQAMQDADIGIGILDDLGRPAGVGGGNATGARAPRPVKNASQAFADAMEVTFAMNSASTGPSNHSASVRALQDLMFRMGVPQNADALRGRATDQELLRLAMLASVGAISMWKRDSAQRLVLSDDGKLMLQYAPSSVESDVMMCIICVLLALILMFHVVSPQPPQPAASSKS